MPSPTGKPSVSVVVRTKDRPALLPRALASIAAQTFTAWRVIIVNDGGQKKSLDKLVAAQSIASKITVVHNERSLGMEAAANRGVAASDTPCVALLDDDDTWEPRFLERTLAFLESDVFGRTCVAAATQSSIVFEKREGESYTEIRRAVMNAPLRNLTLFRVASRNQISNNALVFRRAIYDEVGGFDETLPVLGDWEFLLKVLRRGDVGVIPEALANYHQREGETPSNEANSFTGAVNPHDHYDARIQNKHMRAALEGDGLALALSMGVGRDTDEGRRATDEARRAIELARTQIHDATLAMNHIANRLEQLSARVDFGPTNARLEAVERQLADLVHMLKRPGRALSKAWSRASTLFR